MIVNENSKDGTRQHLCNVLNFRFFVFDSNNVLNFGTFYLQKLPSTNRETIDVLHSKFSSNAKSRASQLSSVRKETN